MHIQDISAQVETWDQKIQPYLNPERADANWKWADNCMFVKLALPQDPKGYALCVEEPEGNLLPCAMMLMVRKYRALDQPKLPGVFLWYVAAAEKDVLAKYLPEDRIPTKLGTLCIDTAITESYRMGSYGRLGLHADPRGGDRLLDFYRKLGMNQLPAEKKFSWLRSNDGRYFYHAPDSAYRAHKAYDKYRAIGVI